MDHSAEKGETVFLLTNIITNTVKNYGPLPTSKRIPAMEALTPLYGPSLDLADAKRVMNAAERAAIERGWPMVIAIVDNAGQTMLFVRLDQAQSGSAKVARQKAKTAVAFRRPTVAFQQALEQGGLHLRILAMTNLMPLEGGLPLVRDGAIVGAIGVSGMQSHQDAEIAQIGAAALG
jgi:glc operon protein GlcG